MKPAHYIRQRSVQRRAARLSVWSNVPDIRRRLEGLRAWRSFLRYQVGSNPALLPALHRANRGIVACVMALELSINRARWSA